VAGIIAAGIIMVGIIAAGIADGAGAGALAGDGIIAIIATAVGIIAAVVGKPL
jgi:hypothetical protein